MTVFRWLKLVAVLGLLQMTSVLLTSFHSKINNLFAINKFFNKSKALHLNFSYSSKLFFLNKHIYLRYFRFQTIEQIFHVFSWWNETRKRSSNLLIRNKTLSTTTQLKWLTFVDKILRHFFFCPDKYWFYYQKHFLLQNKCNKSIKDKERGKKRANKRTEMKMWKFFSTKTNDEISC